MSKNKDYNCKLYNRNCLEYKIHVSHSTSSCFKIVTMILYIYIHVGTQTILKLDGPDPQLPHRDSHHYH